MRGDTLLAAFGADGAAEDDAERAVRSGLALLEDNSQPQPAEHCRRPNCPRAVKERGQVERRCNHRDLRSPRSIDAQNRLRVGRDRSLGPHESLVHLGLVKRSRDWHEREA